MKAVFRILMLLIGIGASLARAEANSPTITPVPRPAAPQAVSPVVTAEVPNVRYTDLGPVPAAMVVHLVVVLKCRHEAELTALVDANSQQPIFAHPALSPEEFQNYFSPTNAQYTWIMQIFVRDGFQIERTYANRTVLDIMAPAAAVEQTFRTDLHRVRLGGHIGYTNIAPAVIPPQLTGSIDGVVGFDNLVTLHTLGLRAHRRSLPFTESGVLLGPDSGFGPAAIEEAYDFPIQHEIGASGGVYDGTGHAVGIVIDADFLNTDLSAFLRYFKVNRKASIGRVPIDGGPSCKYCNSPETTLEVESIAGLAPGADLYVYMTPSLDPASILDAYAKVNSDDKVGVVNSSFGTCESQTTPSNFPQLSNTLAKQGAALGIVYVASSGNAAGAFICPAYVKNGKYIPRGVSTPASGPYFTGVGATTLVLKSSGQYVSEYGWFASGGGTSMVFDRPSFQNITSVRKIVHAMRGVPDIAFDGDPNSGVAFYLRGQWLGPTGGADLPAAIFSALVSELEQMKMPGVASMNSALYSTFASVGYGRDFNDITWGNNFYYNARTGYDFLTGIGSLDGWSIGRNAVGL